MKRGKRRRGHHAHGHQWDQGGNFTSEKPTRRCTACGLIASVIIGKGWRLLWVGGVVEDANRLPACDPLSPEAKLRRFLDSKGVAV